MAELPRDFPPGTELTNDLIQAIVRELWRFRRMDAAPPINIDGADGADPPIFSLGGLLPISLAIAQAGGGGVPARSGTVPGSATVTLQNYDGSNLSASSQTVTALSLWTNAVGASKYMIVVQILGYWWVGPYDC